MPLPVLQPSLLDSTPEERRVAAGAASAADVRWLGLALFWPLVDLRGGLAPWPVELALAAGYAALGALLALPVARLSDRLGRRPVLLASTALFIAGAAVLGFATSPALAVAARLAMGLAAGAGPAVGWVTDALHVERRPRGYGLFGLSAATVALVAPVLGALLAFAPRWAAPGVAAALGLASLVGLLRLPEARQVCEGDGTIESRSDTLHGLGGVLRSPGLLGPLLATACAYGAAALAFGLLPGALATLTPSWIALAAFLALAGGGAGLAAAGLLVDRKRGPLALAFALVALWGAGTILAGHAFDHATGPVLRTLPAFALASLGASAAASAGFALLFDRSRELWRGAALVAHQAFAFGGAAAGAGLGVLVAHAAESALDPLALAALAIAGLAAALLPGPASIAR